jgi:hypothetical protein
MNAIANPLKFSFCFREICDDSQHGFEEPNDIGLQSS